MQAAMKMLTQVPEEQWATLLVMIDRFSKWTELVPLRSATAESLKKAFRERKFARYEVPKVVITDNGVQFASRIFKSFLAEMVPGVKDERWIDLWFQEEFQRRWPGEPCDYRRSSRTATTQNPSARNAMLLVGPLRHSRSVVLEKPSAKTDNSAEDICSDASRHPRKPRCHRRAELIGERRSVADVKH
ncbi:uncharacterized protein [Drosophila suzukii]|uniref:Integrase catalytic domain-containing protein n=1 Tax=Drosophila suzukii TaxID=28584 RepID=A0ABM4TNG3_DROSZ